MTGFGRSSGQEGDAAWHWEVRTVNNRGLDVRLRLPQGYEEFETRVRDAISKHISRGSCNVNLNIRAPAVTPDLRLNQAMLQKLDALAEQARMITGRADPIGLEALLNMKGVIDSVEPEPAEQGLMPLANLLLMSFHEALKAVFASRLAEGERLTEILLAKLDEIASLIDEAENAPARRPEIIEQRLKQQIQRLLSNAHELDPDRLHQEAVLLATKADIEEELKRLRAHVAATHDLIAEHGPAGRKLEFLTQEFQREANTLCSKSNDTDITRIGLRLKSAIDQLREQVQNVE